MCGGFRFYVSLIEGVRELEPPSVALVGGAAIGWLGTVVLLRSVVRRGRSVSALGASLVADEPTPKGVPSLRLHGPLGVALALIVPAVAAVALFTMRREFAGCFEAYLQRFDLPECSTASFGVVGAIDQLEVMGLAALLWLPLLPLAAVTVGLGLAHRARAARLRRLIALNEADPVEAHGRYRQDAHRGHHAARDWLFSSREPAPRRYVIVALAFALLGPGMLSAGVGHMVFRLEGNIHMTWRVGPTEVGGPAWFDQAIANGYALLQSYAAAALVGIAITTVLALVLLRPAVPPRAAREALAQGSGRSGARWASIRFVGPVLAGSLCLLLAYPASSGNAHPAPAFARPHRSTGLVDETKVQVPQLHGPDPLVEAPHVVIGWGPGQKVLLDGHLVGAVGGEGQELETLILRKKELWSSFHPNRPYPGVVLVSAARRLTGAQLVPFLRALRRTDHTTLLLHLSQEVKLDPPPLGIWTTASSSSAVRVSLAWRKDLPALETAFREDLAHGQATESYQVVHPQDDLRFDDLAATAVVARHGGGRAVIVL